jgi:hypothetical protein
MVMLTITTMRRYDPRGSLTISLLTYHSGLAEAQVKMRKRYVQALDLSPGFSDFRDYHDGSGVGCESDG